MSAEKLQTGTQRHYDWLVQIETKKFEEELMEIVSIQTSTNLSCYT